MHSGSFSAMGNATIGRILAVAGLVLLPVAFSVVSVALEAVGSVLGVAGYMLGPLRLGTVTVVLGFTVMLFSLLTQQYPLGPGS